MIWRLKFKLESVKINFELSILNSLKKGVFPKDIAKQLNISLPRLSYHLSKLKSKGVIKKNGLVWEIDEINQLKTLSQVTNFKSNIRGHAFMWKVRFNKLKNMNWKQLLDSKQINYDELGVHLVPRIILEGRKIWLGQKNVIIYEPEGLSFFGENAIESKKLAVYSLLSIIRALENLLGFNLGRFDFTTSREHFSLIKNTLAIQCNKNREKINVYNEKGLWLSIDDSFNLAELETLGSMANEPMGTNLQVQKWWNENKETKFEVTPKYILNTMNGIQQNQLVFDKNMMSHLAILNKLGDAVDELRSEIKKLRQKSSDSDSKLDRWMQ